MKYSAQKFFFLYFIFHLKFIFLFRLQKNATQLQGNKLFFFKLITQK